MSRENRMLVMFVAGMVILFTYFRIQYPNIGGSDAREQKTQAPQIKVICDPELRGGVEKVARSYELEFGIRVLLESPEGDSSDMDEFDLIIAPGEETFAATDGVIHVFSSPPGNLNRGEEGEARWVIGLRSVNPVRQAGASRLARYLVARDRGLPIVSPDLKGEDEADLWAEDPSPTVVVWEGAFPFLQGELQAFEALENVSLRLIVGDCSLVAAKMREPDGVDGILLLGESCDEGMSERGGEFYTLGSRDLVLLSSRQRSRLIEQDGILRVEAGAIGTLPGFHPMVVASLKEGSPVAGLERLIQGSTTRQFSRLGDLLNGLLDDPQLIGLAIDWPLVKHKDQVRMERFKSETLVFPLRLWVSENSDAKYLLRRLGRTLGASELGM